MDKRHRGPVPRATMRKPLGLGSCLGLEMDAPNRCLKLNRPLLPAFLDQVRIDRMRVGDAVVDLVFHRYAEGAGVDVVRRQGELEVLIVR